MSQYIEMHPVNPNIRQLQLVVDSLKEGAVIAYPTDSGYALACCMGQRKPLERIRVIRDLGKNHNFTLICRDLSEISRYARVENSTYRLLKKHTPGGYTFILKATQEVPKLMQNAGKKTIGIRVPDHAIALGLVAELGQPMITSTLIMPNTKQPLVYPEDVSEQVGTRIDILIDAGYCGFEPTTVVDLTDTKPEVLRYGSGDPQFFE